MNDIVVPEHSFLLQLILIQCIYSLESIWYDLISFSACLFGIGVEFSMATGVDIKEQAQHLKSGQVQSSSEEWLLLRVGSVPRNSLGWFRCGVGFYNKKEYVKAIECFEKSVALDPMNVRNKVYYLY